VTIISCDIGGTRIKIGIVQEGRVLARRIIDANSAGGLRSRLGAIETGIRELLHTSGTSIDVCRSLSVAFPSLIDVESGRVLTSYGKYTDAPEIDLNKWAIETFQLPLAIENDARLALIGEWRYGAGRGTDDLVMITLGTGIGTAAVMQGCVVRGRHGQAACLGGHSTIRFGGVKCCCGNLGCAESEASTRCLFEIAKSHPTFATSSLQNECIFDYAAIIKHAAAHDPTASAVLQRSLDVWSALAVNLILAYDPQRLIVGGGIMAAHDVILPAISHYVRQYAHTPWGEVEVVASQLGDDAALVGGEWLAEEAIGLRSSSLRRQ
jgi:glucokinase